MINMIQSFISWIDQSHFWSLIFATVIVFIIIFTIRTIIGILVAIRNYYDEKSNIIRIKSIQLTNNTQILPIDKRVKLTNSVIDLIELSIDVEISNELQKCSSLNQPYKIINLDNSIQTVGDNVYEGLNKDVFTDPNLLFTSVYFQKYIASRTKNKLINTVQKYNESIRQFPNQ